MPETSWSYYVWSIKDDAQLAAYALLFLFSLFRGAAPEKQLSGVFFAMLAFDRIHHGLLGGSVVWRQTNILDLMYDVLALACAFAIALHANRVYPLWVAAFQIISIFGHVYRPGLEETNRFAYAMMAVMPSCVQLITMTLGIACHTSRRRRLGSYPSWRVSWRPTRGRMRNTSPVG